MIKKREVHGLIVKKLKQLPQCETCATEKATRLPFTKNSEKRTNDLLEIVHSDVWDPSHHPSISGAQYFVILIDDKSRYCEIEFIKEKSEVLQAFKNYKARVERQTGKRIKYL